MFSCPEPWKPLVESALPWLNSRSTQGPIQPSLYPIKSNPETCVCVLLCPQGGFKGYRIRSLNKVGGKGRLRTESATHPGI